MKIVTTNNIGDSHTQLRLDFVKFFLLSIFSHAVDPPLMSINCRLIIDVAYTSCIPTVRRNACKRFDQARVRHVLLLG